MVDDPPYDAMELRLLDLAQQVPGAHILAMGEGAAAWAAMAAERAPLCSVAVLEPGEEVMPFLARNAIRHIHILRHGGAGLAAIVDDLERLLSHSRVDFFLFGDFEARAELPGISTRLLPHGYRLFGLDSQALVTEFSLWIGGLKYRRFLAIQQRLADSVLTGERRGLDLGALLARSGIEVAGLLHLGAHEGQELAGYREIGLFPVTFVEAHPDVFQRLCAKTAGQSAVFAVHAAITDRDGPVTLHISAQDQSSSVLPIGDLGRIMPNTIECGVQEVPGRSLDSLFAEWRAGGHAAAKANIMVSDIQGAEWLALRGAAETLPQFDAVVLELLFGDLYTGCGQVEEVDQLMDEAGFDRVATVSTWHMSWSDALYLRRR